jgi:hypothetical protein
MNSKNRFVIFKIDRDIVEQAREILSWFRQVRPMLGGKSPTLAEAAINSATRLVKSGDATCTTDESGNTTWQLNESSEVS